MTVAERPLTIIPGRHRSSGDGVHLVAVPYKKGTRLEPHLHREAQLVYAARGTMQVTTPKGRWLVPPDRAVWSPPASSMPSTCSPTSRCARSISTSPG